MFFTRLSKNIIWRRFNSFEASHINFSPETWRKIILPSFVLPLKQSDKQSKTITYKYSSFEFLDISEFENALFL